MSALICPACHNPIDAYGCKVQDVGVWCRGIAGVALSNRGDARHSAAGPAAASQGVPARPIAPLSGATPPYPPQSNASPGRPRAVFGVPAGAISKPCRACQAPIVWVETPRGKRMPVDAVTGTSHFDTCPNADQFRRARS